MSQETIYICIKQFNARLGDELSLNVGDRIEVLADDSEYNDGWYMGKNVLSSTVGLFPKSFTKLEEQSEPRPNTLLRSRSRRVMTGGSAASNKSIPKIPSSSSQKPEENQSGIQEIDQALKELEMQSLDPSAQHTQVSKGHSRELSSASSLSQDLNPLKATSWTPKQVSSYFALVLGFEQSTADKFARHKITGEILFQLDLPHLKELEIDSFGTRFEIYKEIEKLKQISTRIKSSSKHEDKGVNLPTIRTQDTSSFSPPFNNSDDSQFVDESNNDSQSEHRASKSHSSSRLLPSFELKNNNSMSKNGSASTSFQKPNHVRSRSISFDNNDIQVIETSSDTFMSPRKAPEPPQQSPMSKTFKFGGSPLNSQPSNTSSPSPYMVREKATPSMSSRPASSVYEIPANSHHRRASSGLGSHRRHSSVFSFLSNNNEDSNDLETVHYSKRASKMFQDGDLTIIGDDQDIADGAISPKKSKAFNGKSSDSRKESGPQGKLSSLRSVSTQNFKSLTGSKKSKTSAFTEGIRDISPDESIKTSNYSGWMAKKSGNSLGWRSRYFTLHGTRLSYFTSLRDKREKGLIDITAHKVLPISTEGDSNSSNDKYIALYASSTGFGRYCFKLVPPAPGFKKGLTFTQPKTHYFAVETQEEMRGWLKALMTATIDIDDTVPVVSSCNTPTVTLAKAQELLTKAREETKLNDDELRAKGFIRHMDSESNVYNDSVTSEEASPIIGSLDQTTLSSSNGGTPIGPKQSKLMVDTSIKTYRSPTTPQLSSQSGGFASPYLLASGLLSPKPNGASNPRFASPSESTNTQASQSDKSDYFDGYGSSKGKVVKVSSRDRGEATTPGSRSYDGENLKKKPNNEKMMAYTKDGSFVIKPKKH